MCLNVLVKILNKQRQNISEKIYSMRFHVRFERPNTHVQNVTVHICSICFNVRTERLNQVSYGS